MSAPDSYITDVHKEEYLQLSKIVWLPDTHLP